MDSSRRDRSPIKARDICVGAIVWLPLKEALGNDIICCCQSCTLNPSELDLEGYNHPAIVLKISQKPGSQKQGDFICDIACITSFDSLPLIGYIRGSHRRPHIKDSLPIFHSKSPDEHITQLHLESGVLHKQSYVSTLHIYPVPISSLRSFERNKKKRAYKTRIRKEDYHLLMAKFGLGGDDYEPTDEVPQTAKRRLLALANPQAPLQEIRPAPVVSARIEHARETVVEYPGYGSVPTRHWRHHDSPPLAPVYTSRTHHGHQTWQSLHSSGFRQPPSTYRQSTPTYRQPTPNHAQSDSSGGSDDWSGTLLVVVSAAVFGLITWWRW